MNERRFHIKPHPGHSAFADVPLPVERRGWRGYKLRRLCRQKGGHYWHPTDTTIAWGCCQCGLRRDGFPSDGT